MKISFNSCQIKRAAFCVLFALVGEWSVSSRAQTHPWPEGEKLVLSLFWPSGVNLGEATIQSKTVGDVFQISATVEAVLPQNRITYSFDSEVTADLCSRRFRQAVRRGARNWEEVTVFDSVAGKATVSRDGGKREMAAPKCARDPLAYLYYFRKQVAAGKRPSGDTLFLGGPVSLRIEALAEEKVKISQHGRQGDRYLVTYPGSTGDGFVEIWLERGLRQAPIAVRLPLPLATFSAELQ